jgi:CBS domain-containing protein
MILCPYCESENIKGTDVCELCGQALVDDHLPTPSNRVERALLRDRITDLEPNRPIVVAPDMTVGDVVKLLVERKIGCVFVVDNERIVGVFTERDALTRIGVKAEQFRDRPISEFATPNPRELDSDAKIAFAVRMMDLGGYRHIPIIDGEGKPKGVISVRDILRYLTEHMAAETA